MRPFLTFFLLFNIAIAQTREEGIILANNHPLPGATIKFQGEISISDSLGKFTIPRINGTLIISSAGFKTQRLNIDSTSFPLILNLEHVHQNIDEVVVTGTLKPVRRMESPVPVEVYTQAFLKMNPSPSIFDALQNMNGIRPQLNCNICNTGDIHINGLEGPYTMVLIDGMPIVSSLSTVYGLSGIPNALVERIEVVKGPASSLYGSEAIGGLINIITKSPLKAPAFSADVFKTSWNEINTDIGIKFRAGKSAVLTGISFFNYQDPKDNNNDNFTDVTLQSRISLFQKWIIPRKNNRLLSFAARYFYEDRWGGEMNWKKTHRGGDEVYGESIYTNRWEITGLYELPVKEKLLLALSFNDHFQDSRYGNTSFIARQKIAFSQLTWDKTLGNHDILAGAAFRFTFYDDNTIATNNLNKKLKSSWLPGFFLQDELKINARHSVLGGVRFDHNQVHGNIFTPRIAYKLKLSTQELLRINAGTGYRVVNLFTEDHAALTGARKVRIKNELQPERSININVNYLRKIHLKKFHGSFDVSVWYTNFSNRIIADYETNPNEIIYDNLLTHAKSKGISINAEGTFNNKLHIALGTTFQNVGNGTGKQQILTERFSGTWSLSYQVNSRFSVDYTGNIYGPMRLPLLGELDPRQQYSPAWSIQNIQFTFELNPRFEIYSGIKNLLNWTPGKGNPFLIAGASDPFDQNVVYAPDGKVVSSPLNPYALTFDPNYVYAPNQGIRFFLGARLNINQWSTGKKKGTKIEIQSRFKSNIL